MQCKQADGLPVKGNQDVEYHLHPKMQYFTFECASKYGSYYLESSIDLRRRIIPVQAV